MKEYSEEEVIALLSKILQDSNSVCKVDNKKYWDLNVREKTKWEDEWYFNNLKNYE